MINSDYMKLAIQLALQGTGHTSPNPLVGAVIVKDDQIIGQGYHARYGDLHAERAALAACTQSPEGATIYVTLEPCCHHGKQPPCTEAILESGIKHVIIGSRDPNPLVSGKGSRILREHGIEVTEDFMREECDAINAIFFHYIQTGMPYVTLKYAMTMDGRIATRTGASRWITGEKARENVHKDRNRHAAILAGIGTVLTDDPLLNCRIDGGKDPVRVICDTSLRIPLDSQIVHTAKEIPTIIAVGADLLQASDTGSPVQGSSLTEVSRKAEALRESGCRIL
ncbi:MAG: bifunctional diaminohydroxyphosphoribosylaminopyrimidine deaminase/5-amino-6-(5-phosphoribosylamino)uracil reductase RibD, partial [Firmicutes bacterium]|uniref:bifunctional diaminohydroxyphosphoribosylaminopyrimidine deaminase/5-amino-6-(5-phosphoribosylamino)uracil reductase RibD n=1 Tax=Lentihominibacter sp. TaxID=2944216 RepID=UPI002A4FE9D2